MIYVLKKLPSSVLLEDEIHYRFYVQKDIFAREDEEEIRANGIPYSLPFDLLLEDSVDEHIRLYALGIHTLSDVLNNRQKVRSILGNKNSVEILIEKIKGEFNG